MALREREAIRDRAAAGQSASPCSALVLAAFVLHTVLHLEPSVVALLGAGLLLAVVPASTSRRSLRRRGVAHAGVLRGPVHHGRRRWSNTGVIDSARERGRRGHRGRPARAAPCCCSGCRRCCRRIVDNIPYVATMSPVVADLVANAQAGGADPNVLWWALALGADLGGNATAVGASANVVVLGIAERTGHRISFWEFTRYGLIVTVVTDGALGCRTCGCATSCETSTVPDDVRVGRMGRTAVNALDARLARGECCESLNTHLA